MPEWVGSPELVGEDDGDGEPLLLGVGLADDGVGEAEPELGDGEPLLGLGDADDDGGGDADEDDDGGGVWFVGSGGGGGAGGVFWNRSTAISSARAAVTIISSQLTRIVIHPARSARPGHGSGQTRQAPGCWSSIQCSW